MKYLKICKWMLLVLALLLVAGLISCGNKGNAADKEASKPDSGMETGEDGSEDGESGSTAEDSGLEAGDNGTGTGDSSAEAGDDGQEQKELTSLEVAKRMGNGINLGNTMEAYGRASLGVGASVSSYETSWGMPVTTQEMISAMKAAGFDSLRIPVAWTNAMNFERGDYTIGEDYLNRVEEIINYALKEDMYVIVNDHWDGGWWGMFGSASGATREAAMELYTSMWKQIGEKYAGYPDQLIFESANEELGFRLNDTDIAVDSGTLSEDQCYEMTNRINQAFVDTIRSTGGNNARRFLLIAGFGTDIAKTCDDRFVMPKDTAENKLLLSVHYYNPDGYCINTSLSSWGTRKDHEEQNALLEKMTKFTQQGYGIVLGEYGVLLNNGKVKENTADYINNFLNNCDLYGYVPMLWDCNDMFSRTEQKIIDPEVAALYQTHSLNAQASKTEEEIREAARAGMDGALAAAEDVAGLDENTAMAWIMYNSKDWSVIYSVGDVYDPASKTEGVEATDAEITGEGIYTVSLDFTGTGAGFADSMVFSALGVANGETLFPGYVITIKEVLINGEAYKLAGRPYTTSDDGKCTRVNLYNTWVTAIPEEARTENGVLAYVTPSLLDAETLGKVETISVTFSYGPGK
ncbi:endoglucanase [Anaerotaenia torta]|uniref:glycoside hydrolase family 5 protein n=1 Tax=Anaerotaenia torta TaxID=433293 RepID=UPI003D1BC735